jgi:hypothetical protein
MRWGLHAGVETSRRSAPPTSPQPTAACRQQHQGERSAHKITAHDDAGTHNTPPEAPMAIVRLSLAALPVVTSTRAPVSHEEHGQMGGRRGGAIGAHTYDTAPVHGPTLHNNHANMYTRTRTRKRKCKSPTLAPQPNHPPALTHMCTHTRTSTHPTHSLPTCTRMHTSLVVDCTPPLPTTPHTHVRAHTHTCCQRKLKAEEGHAASHSRDQHRLAL